MKIDEMHYNFKLELQRVDSSDKQDFEPWEIDTYLNKGIWRFLKDRYGISPTSAKRGFETDQARISQLANLHIKSPHLQPGISPVVIQDGLYEVNLNLLGSNINGQYFRYLFLTEASVKAIKDNCDRTFNINHYQVDDNHTIYTDASWEWKRVNYNFGRSNYQHPHDIPVSSSQSPDVTANLETGNPLRFNSDQLGSLYLDTRDKYGAPQFEIDKVYISYVKYPNRVFSGGYDHIDGMSSTNSPQIHCDLDEMFHDEIVRLAARLAQKDILSDYNAMMQDEVRDLQY